MSRWSTTSAHPVFRSSLNGVGSASEVRGELALTHIALCVTVIASVLSLGGILLSLAEDVAIGRSISSLGQGLFLVIANVWLSGRLVSSFPRPGPLNRLRR